MVTFVYDFAQGNKDQKDLLGGKGANLAEMTNLGLPVPPGFTISTEACRAYLAQGREPDGLADEITAHLKSLEEAMGRSLGTPDDPLHPDQARYLGAQRIYRERCDPAGRADLVVDNTDHRRPRIVRTPSAER